MSHQNIIRAWKNEEYRNSLSDAERAQLPENPAGLIELPDEELDAVAAGGGPILNNTSGGPYCVVTKRYKCF
jgi:mersacidin/lichenicidin family type 2 lantibiotic